MLSRRELANAIRALSMDAVEKAKSGHPGAPLGMADMAEALWRGILKHNPSDPNWPDWVADAVFYQIFPDRFAKSARVPKAGNLEAWDAAPTVHGYKGGDLLGVAEHLDHLTELGVNALSGSGGVAIVVLGVIGLLIQASISSADAESTHSEKCANSSRARMPSR